MRSRTLLCIASLAAVAAAPALAQEDNAMFNNPSKITVEGGENVYNAVCRGCHMPEGAGAVGAGAYPALAGNANLEYPEYPIFIILNGQKAMPPLGGVLDDQQIADVVRYIQTHFGNDYSSEVTAESVAASRP
ncbi:cytochrome c [Nitratireductor sp. ZSWI3]|uniref:c-type cytochrome n=1 Tax=Nitratireductor sp. ZSWI3 TaxID=2966359 RepID=UPI00214FE1EF|nr:cytochrome c [Nitratireductor sp. ZSWI3]MCR4268367.1 cytochrome c [Nitratireductor sp. ZSWI3]